MQTLILGLGGILTTTKGWGFKPAVAEVLYMFLREVLRRVIQQSQRKSLYFFLGNELLVILSFTIMGSFKTQKVCQCQTLLTVKKGFSLEKIRMGFMALLLFGGGLFRALQ